MERSHPRLAAFLMLVLVPALFAQFWQKKEWTKWSSAECKELLRSSPWSNEYDMAVARAGGVTTPLITYRAQFVSARPIRLAMMRLEQLDPKYAKMQDDEKKAFNERAEKFINTDFSDYVVIRLSYTATEQVHSLPLSRLWQSLPQEELPKRFVLLCATGALEAARANISLSGGGSAEFQLVYPRNPNGKPIVNQDTKELILEFQSPEGRVFASEKVRIPFKVKNMTLNGELIY